jgi:lysozyme family protein
VRLQNALVALGVTAGGDPVLTSVKIDGIIGPGTVKAVNAALAKYVGATQFFPKANLDVMKVRQYAGGLAGLVEERVRKSGGTIPTPQVVARTPRASATTAAVAALLPQPDAAPDRRWMFWAVGGVSALVLLAVAASAVKKRRAAA